LSSSHFIMSAPTLVSSSSLSPVIRVNRRACRFGRYKTLRRPHPRSLTFNYSHPPLSAPPIESCRSGAQMGSHDWPFLGCIARDGESNPNITLSPILLSHLLISFSPFCNLSPCPLCVNRGLLCSYPLLLRFYVSLSLFTPDRTVLALLSPLLSPTASPSSDGSKTLRRGSPANSRGEWLGSRGP
jgi:hypothetical protein